MNVVSLRALNLDEGIAALLRYMIKDKCHNGGGVGQRMLKAPLRSSRERKEAQAGGTRPAVPAARQQDLAVNQDLR